MNLVLRNRYPLPSSLRIAPIDQSFERLMHGLFDSPAATSTAEGTRTSHLALDIRETSDAYEVEAELPGLRKEDVRISVDAGRISIEAESTRQRAAKEGEKLIHAERNVRKLSRSFSLPVELDESRIEARLEDGILTLTLPKKPVAQPTQIIVR